MKKAVHRSHVEEDFALGVGTVYRAFLSDFVFDAPKYLLVSCSRLFALQEAIPKGFERCFVFSVATDERLVVSEKCEANLRGVAIDKGSNVVWKLQAIKRGLQAVQMHWKTDQHLAGAIVPNGAKTLFYFQ